MMMEPEIGSELLRIWVFWNHDACVVR